MSTLKRMLFTAPRTGKTFYRPDIDGLRAIAVMSVVLFHAFPKRMSGGFIGVDVFFVISGFLISRIIFGKLEEHSFSLVGFYGNRARRILPALLTVIALCLVYGFFILLPTELERLGKHVAGGIFFASNFVYWLEAGYFDVAAFLKPLLHLWSLGVEEQFYIFWPILAVTIHRIRFSPYVVVIGTALLSFAVSMMLWRSDIDADFYVCFSRFWELATGALLALPTIGPSSQRGGFFSMSSCDRPALRSAMSISGLALIVGCAFLLNPSMRFPGWLALLPCTGAALIIAAGPLALPNRTFLSLRGMTFLGLISYPLYLWHWPIISYAYIYRLGRRPVGLDAVGIIVVSIGLAWLTYRFIEKPIRFGSNRHLKTIALAGLAPVIGICGLGTWVMGGFPARYPALPDIDIYKISAAAGEQIFLPTKSMTVHESNRTLIAEIGDGNPILFTGDSLLFHYAPRFEELLRASHLHRKAYFVVGASCAPIPGTVQFDSFAHCREMPKIAAELVAEKNIGTIILGASWTGYRGDNFFVERNGHRLPGTSAEAKAALFANFEDYVKKFVADGRKVYIILATPIHDHFNPVLMVSRTLFGVSVNTEMTQDVKVDTLKKNVADVDDRLRGIAARTGAELIDPVPDICGPGANCSPFFGRGEPKFTDGMHLRTIFAKDHVTFLDRFVIAP